jgi:CHAT domain-containing protein
LAVQSVAFAFLKAGAKCVLASLENVNDEFTAAIMDKFYTGLFATRAPTEALRLTRLHFQKNKAITRELAKWVIYV